MYPLKNFKLHIDLDKNQFTYYPLIWMFYNQKSNHRLSRLHERTLRIIFEDNTLIFIDLVKKLNEKTIYRRYLNLLMNKVFKLN